MRFISMWHYPAVFLISLLVDAIPVVGPPAWTVMVFMQIKFDLNIWGVLLAGVTGSMAGRYLLGLYMPKVSKYWVNKHKRQDLEYMGRRLGRKTWSCWIFVLLYTLTPLSTTALFTAAGMAKVNPIKLLPPFFLGKFTSDAAMIVTGKYAVENTGEILHGAFSVKLLVAAVGGLGVIFLFLFIDWRTLFTKKKVTFCFKIWK